MPTIAEVLADETKKSAMIDDCCQLIDREVAGKSGLGGMAVKGGYKLVQGVKPGFVRKVVAALLPDFAEALAPIHDEAAAGGHDTERFFEANSGRVADALLAVTDARVANSDNGAVKSAYGKLRGGAKKHVGGRRARARWADRSARLIAPGGAHAPALAVDGLIPTAPRPRPRRVDPASPEGDYSRCGVAPTGPPDRPAQGRDSASPEPRLL